MEQPNITPQSPSPAPLTPPPSHRWGLLGGFFVLALALSAGAYFFLSEKYAAEPVIPSYTPRETVANLETYTNTEYGFEFKYPKSTYNVQSRTASIIVSNGEIPTLTIGIEKVPVAGQIGCTGGQTPAETIIIGGKTAQKCLMANNAWQAGIGQVITNGVLLLSFTCHDGTNSDCNQILSTFKFTGIIESNGALKTYKNQTYGFEFTYPPRLNFEEKYHDMQVSFPEFIYSQPPVPDKMLELFAADPLGEIRVGAHDVIWHENPDSGVGGAPTVVTSLKEIKVQGIPVTRKVGYSHQGDPTNYSAWFLSYTFRKGNMEYGLTLQPDANTRISTNTKKEFDQILSTFKFTK